MNADCIDNNFLLVDFFELDRQDTIEHIKRQMYYNRVNGMKKDVSKHIIRHEINYELVFLSKCHNELAKDNNFIRQYLKSHFGAA